MFIKFSLLSLLISILLLSNPVSAQESENVDYCIICHLELSDELLDPAVTIDEDIHSENGISCDGCHGGDPTSDDPEIAMSSAAGFKGSPSRNNIPDFCGKCHSDPAYMREFNPGLPTDQLDKYWTSYHGILMKKGDKKTAQCVSCHSVHDIRSVNDPRSTVYSKNVPQTCANCHSDKEYMSEYQIPVNQYEEYSQGVHGKALLEENRIGSPACNDCHGNHAAVPPGVTSISRVCNQCHVAENELFIASPHKAAFDELGEAECVFCHSNHLIEKPTDKNLGVSDDAICIMCHAESDAGYTAARLMKEKIVDLDQKYSEAKKLIETAEVKGVEASEMRFDLIQVNDELINLRKLIHAFDYALYDSTASTAMAMAEKVYDEGENSMEEIKHRRSGFFIFLIMSAILLVALIYKIKGL